MNKKRLLIGISIIVITGIIYGLCIIGFNLQKENRAKRPMQRNEILAYIKENFNKEGAIYQIEVEQVVDDKLLLLLNDKHMGGSTNLVALASFAILSDGNYKFSELQTCPFEVASRIVNTKVNGKQKTYTAFFGSIREGQPAKFQITVNNKVSIEVFPKNKYFIKVYEMNMSNSVNFTPIGD